jgi:predicted AAA+ superfamily ATPase
VFDEIHKQKGWKNLLKGIYDTGKERMTLLVTGSARLGLYRKSRLACRALRFIPDASRRPAGARG